VIPQVEPVNKVNVRSSLPVLRPPPGCRPAQPAKDPGDLR
jgi:hypothetical protein